MKSFFPIIIVSLLALFIFSFILFISNKIKRQKDQQIELAHLNLKLDEVLQNQKNMKKR
ncbi:DUF4083 family protein [Fictibacillus barbaricus]|uniref:Type II secretory pathway pseudopilin PulG n=1 Tax=Fictibacillus barbaricus TaxID=182136 RepID=A0ABU1TW24_9BACL|nr:DUF4083 family protein [Fictibacillus barbaricus]MDR7071410.1 type II secretory pathway pseudopilin PulG [Fictibacillus barbaricus]